MPTQPPVVPDRSPTLAVLDFLRPVNNHSADRRQVVQHYPTGIFTKQAPEQGQEQTQGQQVSPTIRPSKRHRPRTDANESSFTFGGGRHSPDTVQSVSSVAPIAVPVLGKLTGPSQMPMPSPERRRTSQQGQASGDRPRGRTRGPTACEVCRARKTKCDGQRPTCSYCSKINAECSYLEDETNLHSCHVFGPQILNAVNQLADIVRTRLDYPGIPSEHQSLSISSASRSFGSHGHPPVRNDVHPQNRSTPRMSHLSVHSNETGTTENPFRLDKAGFLPQGLDNVVNWNVFDYREEPWSSLPALFRNDDDFSQNTRPPMIELRRMMELRDRYIAGVHAKNPFINLSQLDKQILNVVELGLDWSVDTCLVALVCSIGALSEPLVQPWSDSEPADINLAIQFWNVAIRRIGFAVGEHTVEAAQCLCLAGDPPSIEMQQMLTLEQTLYFTIFKSEYELRAELALPVSVLSETDPLYSFPVPPRIDIESGTLNNAIFDTERAWYYYLADIASRHLFNRLLQAYSSFTPGPKYINQMLSILDTIDAQLNDWYTSLPSTIAFDLPYDGLVPPLKDDLHHILRSRYVTMREQLYRPFVCMCVEQKLDNISFQLVERLAHIASEGLLYATYRLQISVISRHQGLWIALRNYVTCSMILIAASRAQRRPDRVAAQSIVFPSNWKEQIQNLLEKFGSYAREPTGGCAEIYQLLVEHLGQTV